MANNSPYFVNLGQGLSMMIGLPTIAAWNSETRPKKPRRGTLGFNVQTNILEFWDGEDWYSAPMTTGY